MIQEHQSLEQEFGAPNPELFSDQEREDLSSKYRRLKQVIISRGRHMSPEETEAMTNELEQVESKLKKLGLK